MNLSPCKPIGGFMASDLSKMAAIRLGQFESIPTDDLLASLTLAIVVVGLELDIGYCSCGFEA